MSHRHVVVLRCDAADCEAEIITLAANLDDARAEVQRDGWRSGLQLFAGSKFPVRWEACATCSDEAAIAGATAASAARRAAAKHERADSGRAPRAADSLPHRAPTAT